MTFVDAGAAALGRQTLIQSLELYDDATSVVDERTLEIVEGRRRTAIVRRRGWLVRRVLVVADLVGLGAAFAIAEATTGSGALGTRAEVVGFLTSLPLWIVVARVYGLYDRDEERTDHSTADEIMGVFHLVSIGAWLLAAGSYVTGLAHPTLAKLLLFWASAVVIVPSARAVARAGARTNVAYLQNAVILGGGKTGYMLARKILEHPEYRLNLVGMVGTSPVEPPEDLPHIAVLGGPERLPALIRLFDIERVIVAFTNYSDKRTAEIVKQLGDLDVQVDVVPRLYEVFAPNAGLHMMEGIPLIAMPPARLSFSSSLMKRALDMVVATFMLALASPVLVLIAVAIKLDSQGPVFYRHRRVGRRGREIDVLKFRTMRLEACRGDRYGGESAELEFERLMADPDNAAAFADVYKLNDDPRVTRIGGLLRKLSLDELPQLLNVVGGSLSLVGPRPITEDELPRYGEDVGALVSVRPGVTGYWQINGRSRLAYEDRVRLDLSYIRGWSPKLDVQILANTLRALLTRTGAV